MVAKGRRVLLGLLALAGSFALPVLPKAAATTVECPTVGGGQEDVEAYTCGSASTDTLVLTGMVFVSGAEVPFTCTAKMTQGYETWYYYSRHGDFRWKLYDLEWEASISCGLPTPNSISIYENTLAKGDIDESGSYQGCSNCHAPPPSTGLYTCDIDCAGTWHHTVRISIATPVARITMAEGARFNCNSYSSYVDCVGNSPLVVKK